MKRFTSRASFFVWHHFRNRLLSGLLVLVPLGITLLVLSLLLKATVGGLVAILDLFLPPVVPQIAIVAVSLALLVVILYLVGTLASFVVGRKLIDLGEKIVEQIPIAKTVYATSKQVIELLRGEAGAAGREVALIEFPGPGLKVLGFVTGRVVMADGAPCYTVFVPTTPNPTSGFLEFVPAEKVEILPISVEEAVKLIMSGGVLAPTAFPPRTPSE